MSKLKEIFNNTIGSVSCLFFILFFILFLSMISGSIMNIFGFEYDSIFNVVVFFVLVEIIGAPASIFADSFCGVLLELELIGKFGARFANALLSTSVSIFAILIIDYFMDSITASPVATLVISIFWSIIGSFTVSDRGYLDDLDD